MTSTIDFYQIFAEEQTPILQKVFKNINKRGENAFDSVYEASISVIPKLDNRKTTESYLL